MIRTIYQEIKSFLPILFFIVVISYFGSAIAGIIKPNITISILLLIGSVIVLVGMVITLLKNRKQS